MNKTKLTYPPLTTTDILTIRGEPVVKRFEPSPRSILPVGEEWIYLSSAENTEEHYFFRKKRLIDWTAVKK